MALKDKKGRYHRPVAIEGLNLMHGTCHIRLHRHYSEEERKEDEAHPDLNYCVADVALPEEITATAKKIKTKDFMQKLMYKALKAHEVDEKIMFADYKDC